MIYNDRLTPPANWPSLVRYPSYYADRRLSLLWFPVLAAISLTLSVIGLIITFAVEHSWFNDSFQGRSEYGLWRACIQNLGCDSWFSTNGDSSKLINQRLDGGRRAGLNAWQALEIIFLFLTTATLFILIIALICYRIRHSLHYYLAILAVFCVWPAVCIGIACLFVFGFAVFNSSPTPRDLDWCFYVNLASVILALLGAILLSIYDCLLRKPIRREADDAVVETFGDLNDYPPGLSPSTFVVVRRNKRKRNRPYEYPQILYPNISYPANVTRTMNGTVNNGMTSIDYSSNVNRQTLTPYTSVVTTTKETNTIIPQQQPQQLPSPSPPPPAIVASSREFEYHRPDVVQSTSTVAIGRQPVAAVQMPSYRPPLTTYRYQPEPSPTVQWRQTDMNVANRSTGYNSGVSNDYLQRGSYYPTRYQPTERTTFEQKQEPRVLHYYTGYDYFATIDPSDTVLVRHHQPTPAPGIATRYSSNTPYYQSDDYITSTM